MQAIQPFESDFYAFPPRFTKILTSNVSHSLNDYVIVCDDLRQGGVNIIVHSCSLQRAIMQTRVPSEPLSALAMPLLFKEKQTLCCAILRSHWSLRIVTSDGMHFDVPLHMPIKSLFECSLGIGLQALKANNLYYLPHPLSAIQPILPSKPLTIKNYDVVAVHERLNLLCLFDSESQSITLSSLERPESKGSNELNTTSLHISTFPIPEFLSESLNSSHNTVPSSPQVKMPITLLKKKFTNPNQSPKVSKPQSPKPIGPSSISYLLGTEFDPIALREKLRDSMSSAGSNSFTKDEKNTSSAKLVDLHEISLKSLGVSNDMHFSFSGDFDLLGGLILHAIDKISKKYTCFSLRKQGGSLQAIELPSIRDVKHITSISHMVIALDPLLRQHSAEETCIRIPLTLIEYYPIRGSNKRTSIGWILGAQRRILCKSFPTQSLLFTGLGGSPYSLFSDEKNCLILQRTDTNTFISNGFEVERTIKAVIESLLIKRQVAAAEYIAALAVLVSSKDKYSVIPIILMAVSTLSPPLDLEPEISEQYAALSAYCAQKSLGDDARNTILECVQKSKLNAELSGQNHSHVAHCLSQFQKVASLDANHIVESCLGIMNKLLQKDINKSDITETKLGDLQSFPTVRLLIAFISALKQSSAQTDTSMGSFVKTIVEGLSSCIYDQVSIPLVYLPAQIQIALDFILRTAAYFAEESWPEFVLRRAGRIDILLMKRLQRKSVAQQLPDTHNKDDSEKADLDGLIALEENSKFRFAEDERMHEVIRILKSSSPIFLKVDRASEASDLEYRRKLQVKLLLLCRRSLAYSVGRGMLTLGSLVPTAAEPSPLPPLVLTGRVHPTNSIIALDTSVAPPELTLWPEFHNGVAAGLRIDFASAEKTAVKGRSVGVTRNWIVYNRSISHTAGDDAGHAGLLLGLGLKGHLRVLSHADICDYLTQGHGPTAVAVLLGCAASYKGTANSFISKTLCLHLPALLPARHSDIDIAATVQTAALAGLGLLHIKSRHRLMIEFLLAELSKPPTSDRCDTREAMVLAAGWSLGMVLLGCGRIDGEGTDIVDRLQGLIDGGRRSNEESLFPVADGRNGVLSKSSRVLERTEFVNSDATSPGAIVALSLMYLRSNNVSVAGRLVLPTLGFALEDIRPDLLLFRALGRCLILWDHVQPSDKWFADIIPEAVKEELRQISKPSVQICFLDLSSSKDSVKPLKLSRLSAFSALMAYLSIVSGLCMGVGIVFAGTDNTAAKAVVLKFLILLKSMRDSKSAIVASQSRLESKLLRPHIELAVSVVSVSLATIAAGTGDIEIMRILRELRWKTEEVLYGTHMAMSMSLGLLFLGGGKASFRRDDLSVACLLISLLPRFPNRTVDNQYYLQPMRHLYVLAVENRLLRVEDVDTGEQLRVPVNVELLSGEIVQTTSPCLLPELATVRAVSFRPDQGGAVSMEYFPSQMKVPKVDGSDELPPLLLKKKKTLIVPHTLGTGSRSTSAILADQLLQRLSYDALKNLSPSTNIN